MNRNVESHFANVPGINIQRSRFDRSNTHKSSGNVGRLYPIYCQEVLPGDTVSMETSKVVRFQTMLTPVMDNCYLDTYWFYVPSRLVWDHFINFYGENTESAWIPETEYTIPTISSPPEGFAKGTIADHFGLPVGVNWSAEADRAPIALPFRAYAEICQEFFRDQNLTDPLVIPHGDANQDGSNGDNYREDVANGGMPFVAARYHDYFSSCLPGSQKSAPVSLFNAVKFPVLSLNNREDPIPQDILFGDGTDNPLIDYKTSSYQGVAPVQHFSRSGDNPLYVAIDKAGTSHTAVPYLLTTSDSSNAADTRFSNLYAIADPSFSFTVNDLRLAFALQRYAERSARSGSRFGETINAFFGVDSPDSRIQRPEYLGGNRIPLQVHQVTNNAQTEQDFLGDLGAISLTTDNHFDFQKSFVEPGYLIGVCCVRYDHSYSQGIERFWSRHKLHDFYNPVFSSLGEQPVYKSELYADGNMNNGSVFGFQEAWADYRYANNLVTGEMRPGISNSLASWHLGDYYTAAPSLSDEWIREDMHNVDRTLAVSSDLADQYFFDFYFKSAWTRPMPMYSVPGLIDHH